MPHLRDFLKKKDRIGENAPLSSGGLVVPDVTIVRSSTGIEEILAVPDYPEPPSGTKKTRQVTETGNETLGFRNSSNAVYTKDPTAKLEEVATPGKNDQGSPRKSKESKRFSARLHLHHHSRSRSRSQESSSNLPDNLPEAPESFSVPAPSSEANDTINQQASREQQEAQWEKRATMLAMSNPLLDGTLGRHTERARSRSPSISDAKGDVNIQEAIRLHESGELTESTHMFGQLANPRGPNNALAQVLYGLALRHGWGVDVELEKAIHYLSLAASNSASVEEQALTSGMRKGGAAKGELVLAIFELANCFRHGWGVKIDAIAARQYYEAAANLGDTDAMEEAAWCYLEGFGGSKDKFKAAQYLRLAEKKGSKAVGNSWIWKDKYNPK